MMKPSSLKINSVFSLSVLLYANFISINYPFVVTAISHPKKNSSIPALLVFGDSIVDTGNNDYIDTVLKSNFKPYGRDFPGGKPTGRFSNGRLPSDLLAEALGLKKLLPPFLDPNLQLRDLLTGVTFASASSGYDPVTPLSAWVLSVEDQLNMFKKYIEKLKEGVGEERTAKILAKSLFVICLVSNDIAGTYYLGLYRRLQYDIDQYTSMLVNISLDFQQELYRLGARKIGVLSSPPIGCIPLLRKLFGGTKRQCIEPVNQAAMLYNTKLSAAIKALNESLPNSVLLYVDTYTILLDIVQHPDKFGFEVGDQGCCGLLHVEFGPLCNSFQKVCKNTSAYVFWDGYHPTENAYKILTSEIEKKYLDKFF